MDALFADYLERLTKVHDGFKEALEGLPPAALDWTPGPDMNSLNVLIVHVAGSERFWIGDMIGLNPSGRMRSEEFKVQGLELPDLFLLLDDALAHSRTVLMNCSLSDLEQQYESPLHNGRTYRVAWSLLHNLEHVSIHLGHVQIMRQLWEQRS
jgi:uncharacterized damage-inducible protein DinB